MSAERQQHEAEVSPPTCACGCGLRLTMYRGKFARFIHGHHRRGVKHSLKTRTKMSAGQRRRYEEDPEYSDKVSKAARSQWADPVKRERILAGQQRAREATAAS